MGFRKRTATTGKVAIPKAVREEIEIAFFHEITHKIEKYNVPNSLILNLDQTPTKYVPGSSRTQAQKGSVSVPIAGSNDKRMITATFTITLDGLFLAMQLIYGGKTSKSLPRVSFPQEFTLSVNEKHYSNEQESLKLLDDVIIPYIEKERGKLQLPTQAALLIMDVFRGQMTNSVIEKLASNNIQLVKVPANLTHIYQPLDATVNGAAKQFMKKKFVGWYAKQIVTEMNKGTAVENIDVKMKLSIMKPLHAYWLIQLYDFMTSSAGREICVNGWKKSGIYDAVRKGTKGLPKLDPFHDIDPLVEEVNLMSMISYGQENLNERQYCHDRYPSDSESEWEDDDGNIFERLNGESGEDEDED